MAASVGPTHGSQPRPKRKPITGAAASPTAGILWMRHSRWEKNGSQPAKASPSRIVSTPSTKVSWSSQRTSHAPAAPVATPSSTNTRVKPATKSTEPASIRPRRSAPRSAPDSPVA